MRMAGVAVARSSSTNRYASSRAAHTDLMDNCEQVFDEPVIWRQSAQRDPRVKIRSDGNSLLDSQRS